MPVFEPPTTRDWTFAGVSRDAGERRFWNHFGLQPRGRSVLKINGTWQTIDLPTTTQVQSTDRIVNVHGEAVPGYFDGGHVYEITAAVAAELVAAGYTVT